MAEGTSDRVIARVYFPIEKRMRELELKKQTRSMGREEAVDHKIKESRR